MADRPVRFPKKLWGVNVPLWLHGAPLWGTWPWSDIDARLTQAAAAGLNCVRVFGNVSLLAAGTLPRADYKARWAQVADRCAALGLRLYPCGFVPQWEGAQPLAATKDAVAAMIEATAACPHVVGYDLVNESAGFVDPNDAAAIYGAVRPLTGLPLTFSQYVSYYAGWVLTPWDAYAALCDFIDIHVYLTPAGAADLNAARAKWPTKDILLGEFGSPKSDGQPARTARYHGTLACANRPDVAGALAWTLRDGDQGEAGYAADAVRYGLYAEDGTPYAYLLDELAAARAFNDQPPPDPNAPDGSLQTLLDGLGHTWKRWPDLSITIDGGNADNGKTATDMTLLGNGEIHVLGTNNVWYRWNYATRHWYAG